MTDGKDVFRFRRFAVEHGRSSMRVGTDAVLLGAWAYVENCARVLDVGTGCGVVALMVAQRATGAVVTGIDVDGPSVSEAEANFLMSPFANRLHAECADVRTYVPTEKFDCVVSNPPYFTESLLPPVAQRAVARHVGASGLCTGDLLKAATGLLHPGGRLAVVLPADRADVIVAEAVAYDLYLLRRTAVRTVAKRPVRRVLLEWQLGCPAAAWPAWEELLLTDPATGGRSAAYAALTREFYL